eukprot:scaffold10493_cov72-Skeletonema_dohrnii-CCMP3373.AAC.4
MAKSKKKTAPPAPPLPPWQRLHKPVAPPKTAEEIAAEKAVADAAKDDVPPAAAAAGVPTDLPSDEPNQTKNSGDATNSNDIVVPPLPPLKSNDSDKDSISGEINDISTIPPASKNKKKGPHPSKKSHGDTIDSEEEDSDDEPIFKDFKAVKCPRTSVSAEAYAKRLREGEKDASWAKNEDEMPPLPPLRRGTRDRGGKGASSLNNEASADDIDALAISVAESSESFDIAAAVAKMPSKTNKKKKAAKSKASPKKKGGSSAKAPKKSAA